MVILARAISQPWAGAALDDLLPVGVSGWWLLCLHSKQEAVLGCTQVNSDYNGALHVVRV